MRKEQQQNAAFIVSHIGKPIFQQNRAFAFRMLSCLILCTSGLAPEKAWSQTDDARTSARRAALIIPKNSQDTATNSDSGQPESFESYQIRILRNQNHIQAEKIKALREELLEATQKLHDIKPNLFRQSDPSDKDKIADLSLKLGDKEDSLNKLTQAKRELEADVAIAKKKIAELETVKEALAAMVEKQRVAKEQTQVTFKKQMDDLNNLANNEKNTLLNKIKQHEINQERLNQLLAEKGQIIKRLDTVSSQQDISLNEKKQELHRLEAKTLSLYDDILSLSAAYHTHQAATDEKLNNLEAALDAEKRQTRQLEKFKDEMTWLSDFYNRSQTFLTNEIASLNSQLNYERSTNAELQLSKAELEQHRIELALLQASQDNYKSEMSKHMQQLTATIELENSRSQDLEKQLLASINHHQISQLYAESLETLLKQMDDILSAKETKLNELRNSHEEISSGLLSHLDNTDRALEISQNERNDLQQQLETIQANHVASEQEYQQRLAAMKDEQAEKENRWQGLVAALHDDHTIKEKEWQQKLAANQEDLSQQHHNTVLEMQQLIQDALARHSTLEELLSDANEHSSNLEGHLAQHQQQLNEKEAQLRLLEQSHLTTQSHFSATADEIKEEIDHHLHRRMMAEMALQDSVLHASRLEQELENHKDLLRGHQLQMEALEEAHNLDKDNLLEQIEQLQATLNSEKSQGKQLKDELSSLLENNQSEVDEQNHRLAESQVELQALKDNQSMSQDELTHRLQQLSTSLDEEQKKVAQLNEQLQFLSEKYTTEQLLRAQHEQRANALSADLEEKIQLLASLDGTTAGILQDKECLQNENSELLQKVSMLHQQYLDEQDRSQLHQSIAEKLREDLSQTEALLTQAKQREGQILAKQQDQIAEWKDHETQLRAHYEDILAQKGVRTDELYTSHQQELEQLQSHHQNNIDHLQSQHQNALVEMHRKQQEALALLEAKHEEAMTQLLSQHDEVDSQTRMHEEQLMQLHKEAQAQAKLREKQMVAQYQQMLAESNHRAELLQSQYDEAFGKITDVNSQHEDFKASALATHQAQTDMINALQQQVHAEQSRNSELRNDLAYAREIINHERANLINLEEIANEMAEKLNQLQEQFSEAQIAMESKDLQIQTVQDSKIAQKQAHMDAYNKLLQALEEERQHKLKLQQDLDSVTEKHQVAQQSLNDLDKRVSDMQQDQRTRLQLQEDLDLTTAMNKGLQHRLEELEQHISQLQQELEGRKGP